MAKAQGQVTKIYELRTLGYPDLSKQLDNIAKKFDMIKRAKQSVEGKILSTQDTTDLKKYGDELVKLKIQEQELRTQRQQMINDQKAAQIQRQTELNQQRQKIDGNKAEEGSIFRIRRAISELNALTIVKNQGSGTLIDFRGQLLTYDQAIAKLKELTAAEQAFRRQFAADKTLVGEYTTGIVQAFKQMGLDDLVAGQITKAGVKLKELNKDFDRLQQELSETKVSGKGSLEVIETQLVENRREAIALQKEVGRLNTAIRGTGDIGNQITTSISNGFKNLKGQIGSLIIGYVGVQAAVNGIQSSFSDTVRLDSLEASLTAVSGTSAELAINEKFLDDITERLGLTVLDTGVAFKNFYAAATQAGITTDQTREIFTAAASASANLKLSQEQTNGVLLAFGQIASKGKVQAEELRGQIGERIPGAFSIAARAIGVTQIQLNKMLEKGEVLASEFLPKFAAELQKTFGVDASKKVEGLQANVNRLKNEFTSLLESNRAGLTSFFTFLINSAGVLIRLLPLVVAAFGLYIAEQIRAYVVTQLTTKGTILYNIALGLQALRVRAVALATKLATAEMVLFNGAIRVSPLGWLFTLLGVIIPSMAAFAFSAKKAKAEMDALNAINKESNKISDEQIGKLNALAAVVRSSATSLDTKKKAVEDLIKIDREFSSVIKDNTIDLIELERALNSVTNAIKIKARAEASAKLTAEKQASVDEISILRQRLESEFARQTAKGAKGVITIDDLTKDERKLLAGGFFGNRFTKAAESLRETGKGIVFLKEDFANLKDELVKAEEERIVVLQDYFGFQKKSQDDLDKFINSTGASAKAFEVDVAKMKAQIESLDKDIGAFQGTKADLDKKTAERKKLQDELDKLLDKDKPTKTPGASKLTGAQKDLFKDIDAVRDQMLAEQTESFEKGIFDEETFLGEILDINTEALNKKLKLLTGKNAEERKQIAELSLEKVKIEKDTNNKIFELRSTALKEVLDTEIANAKEEAKLIADDPFSTEEAKAQGQLNADKKILTAQVVFNTAMDKLEKDRNNISKKNAQDRARDAREAQAQINEDLRNLTIAQIEDQKIAGEKIVADFRNIINRQREVILNSTKNRSQKKAALTELDKQALIGQLAREVDNLKKLLPSYQKLLAQKAITEEEYANFYDSYVKKLKELNDALSASDENSANLRELLTNKLSKLFKFKEGSAEAQLFAETLSKSFDLAKTAMEDYFSREEELINHSRDVQLKRLEVEEQQVLARSQSQAEEESIRKQFAARQEQINRDAFEKNKKLQREQAKINLAIQLSNLAVIAFAPNPLNIATLGTAGAIMYAIQAALAIAGYALNISRINSAQYEKGGAPTKTGGQAKGKPHSKGGIPFRMEAENKELFIINKKSAEDDRVRTITGTNKQIASLVNQLGGGIAFKPGARVTKFESGGYLGQSLQAPVFNPSPMFVNTGGVTEEKWDEMMDRMEELATEQSKRIDRIEVVQKTSTVTDAQRKQVKQNSIGTL